jgi:transcription elongation factor S-II
VKLGKLLKKLKTSNNPEVKKTVEELINKWRGILKKTNEQEELTIESVFLKGENVSKRNNTRKNLYKYLEGNLKEKNNETKKALVDKVVEIEEKLHEILKGEIPYINRVLEIIHNLKDENNNEFRNNIIDGKITPEELCTMDATEMLNKNKQEEIEKQIKERIDEVRTDWNEKHGEVTEGVYKCRVCGGKKTIQHEQQTRSADEPMTLFITCVNCKNTWKG